MRPWLVYLGELRVPTYFFMLMFGFALCSGVIAREARRAGIGERRIIDLSLLLIPAALVGARLFHAIFERPGFYL
jgi:phosphatidylglycerol:prolipoprotein diacylglycerol transferase